MARANKVPDAWDDDWETLADQVDKEEEQFDQQEPTSTMTRSERLAKHAEQNRKLWEAAEKPPEEPIFVAATSNVPLATGFKPALKLLSRKPAPKTVTKRDPVTGLERLTLEDDDDEDPNANKHQPTPEEIRLRQQKELEEKQRRYEEARARIMGGSNPTSGTSTPGTVTPPQADGRQNGRARGRGRGSGGYRGENRHDKDTCSRRQQPQPGVQNSTRELFDPGYSPKPGFTVQRRDNNRSPGQAYTARDEDQIIRAPRGPDGSGRGGSGFAKRGGAKD